MLKDKSIKNYLPEILTLCLYMILMSIIMYFHEPWYDEAQAWLIARDASLKEILFELPHYEGHPPIWHLILLPFAKLGAPYELSLKFVSLTFSSIAVGLFIFRSPFERKIKLLIPFTYFFFYQYGVISRPYCVMMLGFVLAAMFYKDKDQKPFRFIIALAIICSSSAYGIILSCGICIVWLIEMFRISFSLNDIKIFMKQRKFKGLCLLFLYNIALVISILPSKDTSAINIGISSNKCLRGLIYYLFILPGDSTYLDICNYDNTLINLDIYSLCGILGSSIIIIGIVHICKINKKLKLMLVPYIMMTVFCSYVYFCTHHIGIITLFFMFILWCCKKERKECNYKGKLIGRIIKKESDIILLKMCPKVILNVVIFISISYSVIASINEIRFPYGEGREISNFIKNNNLTDYKIMGSWNVYKDKNTSELRIDTSVINNLAVLPYFKNNFFYNFNQDMYNQGYILHKIGRDEENFKLLEREDKPDIIIGYPQFKYMPEANYKDNDYVCIYEAKQSYIWKTQVIQYETPIYIRKELKEIY